MSRFDSKGVVLEMVDFKIDWPGMASEGGLTTIALHKPEADMPGLAGTADGKRLLGKIERLGLEVETEIHAMRQLLPESLFAEHPDWFRVDMRTGERKADCNLCPSCDEALRHVAEAAADWAKRVPCTTNRFYFWPDDGRPWCHCKECAKLSDSDQTLLVTNAVAEAIRREIPDAGIAYLAYAGSIDPPREVRPAEGVFLEYAPYRRCWRHPIDSAECAINRSHVKGIERLLETFGTDGAQVLEYWIDVSLFSGYRRPVKKLPFLPEVMKQDLRFYSSLGFRRVTSFACWLREEYVQNFGRSDVEEYCRCFLEVDAE